MPGVIYRLLHLLVPPLLKAIWRPRVSGTDRVPRKGGVIFASNHLSFADSVVIPSCSPRPVHFLAKKDYFTQRGVRGFLMRLWFEGLGMLPVDREDTQAALGTLEVALQVLGEGEAFGIYPEGTRSRDGLLYRGRTGVAHLALTAKVPVVPVGLRRTNELQPIDSRLPRLVRVEVAFGEPIQVAGRFDGMALGKARRLLTDEIMAAIQRLSGQEEAGVYNERAADA
jgi:1-acyl-sn-glycerol-3-phosphate acyltransferase